MLDYQKWSQPEYSCALNGLTACRNLLALPVMSSLKQMFQAIRREDERWVDCYCDAFYALMESGCSSLGGYLKEHLLYDESPLALSVAKGEASGALLRAAGADLTRLNRHLLALPWEELCSPVCSGVALGLPQWEPETLPPLDELLEFYRRNGCGQFAKYRAFVWQDSHLIPVARPDCVPSEELIGYQRQRDQVIANTKTLLSGRRVNNMLLYGSSGTGKSATVKALLGMEGMENLRLIEVDKEELTGIPELVRMLGHQPQKFILFIDDLAFDKDDRNYSLLKTILEGSVEPRPDNVAVYATSNRRHLVRETFSDRLGDEIDARETIQEKTSLAERFGLRVVFQELTKPQFLNLVRRMAQIKGVTLPDEELTALAVRWDVRNPNRTPRSAVQFIDSLAAR